MQQQAPMGYQQPMMAPQPMAMNTVTNNQQITNTTIIMQEADPYKDANGITED